MKRAFLMTVLAFMLFACAQPANDPARTGAQSETAGPTVPRTAEIVAAIDSPMPTGVSVSKAGRIFLSFPRWSDNVSFTVAEWKNGRLHPYPDSKTNRGSPKDHKKKFVSVQTVVIDPLDRLWILDTGSVNFGRVAAGAAKLMAYDLKTDKLVQTITFPRDVVLERTYLNDVRFDLRRGSKGTAFITDSSGSGPNGIIVVDLASAKSWRKLSGHPSTKAAPGFVPRVEGNPLYIKQGKKQKNIKTGIDGLALSADGKRLYYCPLAGRRLYSVSTDALADKKTSDAAAAKTIEDLGERAFASDGLESDASGALYLTDYENNAVYHRTSGGNYTQILSDPRMIWPDTLFLAQDGYLYVTANQLNRQPLFQGSDRRKPPYLLLRINVGAQPVRLSTKAASGKAAAPAALDKGKQLQPAGRLALAGSKPAP